MATKQIFVVTQTECHSSGNYSSVLAAFIEQGKAEEYVAKCELEDKQCRERLKAAGKFYDTAFDYRIDETELFEGDPIT